MFKKTMLAMTVLASLSGGAALAQDMPPGPGIGDYGMGDHGMGGPGMHGGFEGHGMHGGMHGEMALLAGLKLTPAQHKQLHEIFQDARHAHKGDWKQLGDLHRQIEDVLLAPGAVDKAKLTTLTQQIEGLRQAEAARRLDIAVKIHDILTPDQLAQARARVEKIRALRQEMHDVMKPVPGK